MKWKMAATAGLNLTLDPMGKVSQNASSVKPLVQLKPNCPGMIIGRSSTKYVFYAGTIWENTEIFSSLMLIGIPR
jgi:hypothetical protein